MPVPKMGKQIDMAGIARLLGVKSTTPQQWRQRQVLPEADPELSFPDKPIWATDVIIAWAKQTGRWPYGDEVRKSA